MSYLTAVMLLVTVAHPKPAWVSQLEARIPEVTSPFHGQLTLWVEETATGAQYGFDAERPVYLSSVFKLAVMVEALHQVDRGELSLEETLAFGPEQLRDGMGSLVSTPMGTRFTVGELLELMLVHSNNAAADLLSSRIGLDAVNSMLVERGIRMGPIIGVLEERRRIYSGLDPRGAELSPAEVHLLGLEGGLQGRAERLSELWQQEPPWTGADLEAAFEKYYAGQTHSASMRELGELLGQLSRCEGLSENSCSLAHDWMERCSTGSNRLRAGLGEEARWLHKTGTQHRRACDVGLLSYHGGEPWVVAACVQGFTNVEEAERLLAEVGAALAAAIHPRRLSRSAP